MDRLSVCLVLLGALRLSAQQPAGPVLSPTRQAAAALQAAFVEVADQVMPGVVTIRGYVREAAPQATAAAGQAPGWVQSPLTDEYPGFHLYGSGSGFFVSAGGDVLTCLNYLQREDGSLVDLVEVETAEQKHLISQIIGAEPTVNLAILRLAVYPDGVLPHLTVLRLGDSGAVRTGQFAFAVGDPDGPEKFFAVGTFASGAARDCYQELRSSFYLQAALVVPPEAYGGPLVSLDGDVMGILAPHDPRPGPAVATTPAGLCYALPSSILAGLYETISKKGSFRSPWLGFSVMSRAELLRTRGPEAFEALVKPRVGLYIEDVFDPSPAFAAGVRPGDFLVTFDGADMHVATEFQRQLYLAGIGGDAHLEVFHEGESKRVTLRIEERPPEAVLH